MVEERRQKRGAERGRARRRKRKKQGAKPPKRSESRLRRWGRRLGVLILLGATTGLIGAASVLWYYGRDLPSISTLQNYRPPQTTRVVDRHGELIGEVFSERRTVIPMDEIPRPFVLCVLAAEDADFYRHEGLDYPGILRAIVRDVLSGRSAQGASTITQQVVKLMLLTPERTLSRKIRELILARRIEQELTKEEILHLYLNHINFGHGRYGVQEASQFYFGKDAADLTLAEASLIAGVPQAPARLSPRAHPEAARRRQLYVLGQLESKRAEYWPDISEAEIGEARDFDVPIIPRPISGGDAPEVMTLARRTLREQVGEEAFLRGGYTVHTAVDLGLQRQVREALRTGLEAVDERQHHRAPLKAATGRRLRRQRPLPDVEELREGRAYRAAITGADDEEGRLELDVGGHRAWVELDGAARYNPDELPPSEFAEIGARVYVTIRHPDTEDEPADARLDLGPQGAAIVIDPRTRDVLAMVGAYEASSGFNRALNAVRQPGSTFKPIVYARGIQSRRFTPASIVLDAPAVYDQWQPSNYEAWRHEGAIPLRQALARSVNVVAVRVMEEVGPAEVVSLAQELGIESELEPTLALALGASAVRPIEMVNAYATFAAGGRWSPPRIVVRIEGPDGEVALPTPLVDRDVLTPAEAYVVTSMLTSVVQDGTATRARRLGRPAAGKTGTSNEVRNAWFVGYTPSVVAGVWVGYDDRRPIGRRESGGRTALPIWVDAVRAASEGPALEFPMPSGVVTATIDPASGLLAYEGMQEARDEVFLEGTAPTETARPPDVADPNTFLMEQFGAAPTPDAGLAPDAASAP